MSVPSSESSSSFVSIAFVSLRAVGTAASLALAGVYLHRRNLINNEIKTGFSRYLQHVALPALFFTRLVSCGNNSNDKISSTNYTTTTNGIDEDDNFVNNNNNVAVCTSVLDHVHDAWIIVLWPLYVVGCGLIVGYIMTSNSFFWSVPQNNNDTKYRLSKYDRCGLMSAIAFSNSAGLPITLLTLIQSNLIIPAQPGNNSNVSSLLDFNQFLAMYLIVYPVLQWSVCAGLLGVSATTTKQSDDTTISAPTNTATNNDSNNSEEDGKEPQQRQSINETKQMLSAKHDDDDCDIIFEDHDDNRNIMNYYHNDDDDDERVALFASSSFSGTASRIRRDDNGIDHTSKRCSSSLEIEKEPMIDGNSSDNKSVSLSSSLNINNIISTINKLVSIIVRICRQTMQPPVIGALVGLFVTSTPPLRMLFVTPPTVSDDNNNHHALFGWFFDALRPIGQGTIAIGMTVVGVNLSMATKGNILSCCRTHNNVGKNNNIDDTNSNNVLYRMIGIVLVGKMILLPLIGTGSVLLLQHTAYFQNVPMEVSIPLYLVMITVFITPTANSVMVMQSLGRCNNNTSSSSSLLAKKHHSSSTDCRAEPEEGIVRSHLTDEAMAQIVGCQYIVAPIVLSFWLSITVHIATRSP